MGGIARGTEYGVHKVGTGHMEAREEYSDIPFCLFLTLARLFNRAPSTGANGCRIRVAMAEKAERCRC